MKEMMELTSVRVSPGAEIAGRRELMEASTVAEFVSPLLALMPPVVHDLLTTFNSTGCGCSGQAQDGLVLQAIQDTEAYREVTRIGRASNSSVGDGEARGGVSGDKSGGKGSRGGLTPNGLNLSASMCPDGSASGCGCSSRHMLSIVTYSLLSLMHKRKTGDQDGGDSGVDGGAEVGKSEGGGIHVWDLDPLKRLPKPVADESLHVASILEGLVGMECAEAMQCTTVVLPSG